MQSQALLQERRRKLRRNGTAKTGEIEEREEESGHKSACRKKEAAHKDELQPFIHKGHMPTLITTATLRAMRALIVSVLLPCLSCVPSAGMTPEPSLDVDLAMPQGKPSAEQWLLDSLGYEIFVRSFADSGSDGSGDLTGIRQRLPYLQSLGVNLLWLTPIHPSPSYHGYDVTDYDAVHPDFGSLGDLDRLLAEAHQRGMRVILDLVVNHTAKTHPWFVAAKDALTGSPASQRYLFRGNDPGWQWLGNKVFRPLDGQPGRFYYGLFSSYMPDLNLRDVATAQAMEDIADRWLARGIDGFRLDAARYLTEWPDPTTATSQPSYSDTAETHQYWQRLRHSLSEKHPQSVLIGEVWSDVDSIASYHSGGKELHAAFHFPLAGAMIDSIKRGTAKPLRDTLEVMARGTVPARFFSPFLTNHDQRRLATELGGDLAMLRSAATLLLGMPGTPFLYYGEEVGLAQSSTSGDRGQRAPMPWDVVQKQSEQTDSLLAHYRRLGQLRKTEPGLRSTTLQMIWPAVPDDRVLAIYRSDSQSNGGVILVWNLGTTAAAGIRISLPSDFPQGTPRELLGSVPMPSVTAMNRTAYVLPTIPPRGALWIAP